MSEPTKIDFRRRRISAMSDVTDLVSMLFPGNRNQQYASARILVALKAGGGFLDSLGRLEEEYRISRRTLQRARAKLARLGLIERVTWMHRRYDGRAGWKLSGRMSTALRSLAERIDSWRANDAPAQSEKEGLLVSLLEP